MGLGKCMLPKQFLKGYTLKRGSYIMGAIMFVCTKISAIILTLQTVSLANCEDCEKRLWKQLFSFHIEACITIYFMLLIQLSLFYGIHKGKQTVLLIWSVASSIFLWQCFVHYLNLVVLIANWTDDMVYIGIWVGGLIAGVFVAVVDVYAILIVFAHYLELRDAQQAAGTN